MNKTYDADLIRDARLWASQLSYSSDRQIANGIIAQLEHAKEESDSWRDLAEQRATNWTTAEDERDRAQTELDLVARAIPGVRYMDPPDGGSVTLAEQVERMRTELITATALAQDYARQAIAAAQERDRLREALSAILKHQQVVGGDLRNMSTIATIARAALANARGEP